MVMSRPASFDTPKRQGGSPMTRFSSMFSQLLKLFPRTEFQALVKRTLCRAARARVHVLGPVRGYAFCQVGRAYPLLEIFGGLASCEGTRPRWGNVEQG